MWRIVGLIESRSGDIEFLPQWAVSSTPELGDFGNYADAQLVADAMVKHHAQLKERTPIRYMVMPVIDEALLAQLRGAPAPQPVATPQLGFNAKPASAVV